MAQRKTGPQGHTNSKTYAAEAANMTRGFAVKVGVNVGGCNIQTTAGGRGIGVLAESTISIGDAATVVRQGDAVGIAGGAITIGTYVKANASGKLVAVTGTAGDGEEVIGRAESPASADGDEFIVFVNPFVL
jgi:hypothetical protein